ncbi:MAG: radical SAM protein [Phyllobacteriaceae bacterium]|nr:radical SAM protein [Phyllobacteriaceae bacterium]
MEPLPIAVLAGLTPQGVEIAFHDDRMEAIPFDRPTDLVAIPVETYTAKRAYQIASDYRRRGVPVVIGGFHATLMPDEVARHAEAVVVGEAEGVWPEVIEDAAAGRLRPLYRATARPDLTAVRLDRAIFRGRRYLPIRLVETGRGCRFPCDFCAVQSFFERTHRRRPIDDIVREVAALAGTARLFFFVDDNFAADRAAAGDLADALAPLGVRWITQMSIDAAHDEALLARLARGGCRGVLIGFESLDPTVLRAMRKSFNTMKGGFAAALANLARARIAVYGTFVFGYGPTAPESFEAAVDFAIDHGLYIAAFNHLTPFPGTPLYRRLEAEGRLRHERWWLDDAYRYNDLPFRPEDGEAEAVRAGCLAARRRFYGWRSIGRRLLHPANRADRVLGLNFLPINLMHAREIAARDHFPLGDPRWQGPYLDVA